MKLVYIHGAPASGKLAVAQALLELAPGRLFDNHVAIDVAKRLFDFGGPGFWRLVRDINDRAFDLAAAFDVPLVVATACYSHRKGKWLEAYEKTLDVFDGELLPVFLHCSDDETRRRLGNPDRAEAGKLTDPEQLAEFLRKVKIGPVLRPNCMSIDTGKTTPQQAAQAIFERFALHDIPLSAWASDEDLPS